jgi:hypothetical protein
MPTLDLTPFLEAKEIPGFKPILYNSTSKVNKGVTLIDIAMRTSSAAINLPVYQKYSEGGSYANDPCVFGLSFALQSDPDTDQTLRLQNQKLGLAKAPNDIKLLSIGCGSDGSSYVPEHKLKKKDWGFLKWSKYIVNLVIDTNMVANQYLTKEILPKENYLRINAYYRDESAQEILRKAKKLKIDVTDPNQLKAIKDYAASTFDANRNEILTFIQ